MSGPIGLGVRTELGLAAVGVTSVLVFRRVFSGWSFFPELAAAAVLPILIGGVGRRLRLPLVVTTLVTAVAGALYLSCTLFPSTTALGVPCAGTVDTIERSLRVAWDAIPNAVAPVTADAGFLLLAGIGVWVMAMAADTLAVSWELPLVGLLPWLSLVAVISAVGAPRGRTAWAGAFLTVALAYLAVSSVDERRRRTRPLRVDGRRVGVPLRGAGVAAAIVALAIALAPAVPGFGAAPLVRYKSGGLSGDRTAVSPLVTMKARLQENPPRPMFVVTADRPAYWRTLALDEFNGEYWGASGRYKQARGSLPPPPGNPPAKVLRQSVRIQGLEPLWLPAAYAPRSIDAIAARVDPLSLSLSVDRPSLADLSYVVDSEVAIPSADELRAISTADPREAEAETRLPGDFPSAIVDEARRLTAAAASRYDKVVAIQDHLRTFDYSEDPPAGHDEQSMVNFLFRYKKGYCEQFAGTMAAMVRSLGIPARVAVGFTAGTVDPQTGAYAVTTRDGHAWVEVFFPGYGWLQFEPTPSRHDPTESGYNGTNTVEPPVPTPDAASPTPPAGASEVPASEPSPLEDADAGTGAPGAEADTDPQNTSQPPALVMAPFAAPVLMALTVVGAKAARRRSRLRAPPGRRAQALWREVCDLLVDAGMPLPLSETALETAWRAEERFGVPRARLSALARAGYGELFAPGGGRRDATALVEIEREVRRKVLSELSVLRRLRVHVSLASLRRHNRSGDAALTALPTRVARVDLA